MRVRVIPERMAGRAPQPQHLGRLRRALEPLRVDEAVGRRRFLRRERRQDAARDVRAAHPGRQRAVHRQVVERQGDARRDLDRRRLDVAVGQGQERRPVRAGGVAAACAGGRRARRRSSAVSTRGELGGAEVLLAQQLVDRARPRRRPGRCPFASTQPPSTCARRRTLMNTGRGAHRAISSWASTGRSSAVSGPAYLRKLPAIQWYSPEPATFSTSSPKLRRWSLAPPSPDEPMKPMANRGS